MATRSMLHKTKLQEFTDWLISDGWIIDPNNGEYQVLRARKDKRFLVLYDRHNAKEHYTVRDVDMPVLGAYFKAKRRATPESASAALNEMEGKHE